MTGTERRIALVDFENVLHRCGWAIKGGRDVDPRPAIIRDAVARTIEGYLRELNIPPALAEVVEDGAGGKLWRQALYPPYKAQRKPSPWLDEARGLALAWCDRAGIARWHAEGWEADDVIATVAAGWDRVPPADGGPAHIWLVSSDSDLLQCLTARVSIFRPGSSRAQPHARITEADFAADYGWPPTSYPFYKALRGDQADNIPGVFRIGDVGARKLVREWRTLGDLLAGIGPVAEGEWGRIGAMADQLRTNLALITLRTDVDLTGAVPHADA